MGAGSFGGIGGAAYGAFRPVRRKYYGLKMQHNTVGITPEKELEHKSRPGYQSQASINDWAFVKAFIFGAFVITAGLIILAKI